MFKVWLLPFVGNTLIEWPPEGSAEDRKELFQILQSRECTTLVGNDVLTWDSEDLFGKFSVSTGYVELLRQTLGDIKMQEDKCRILKFC